MMKKPAAKSPAKKPKYTYECPICSKQCSTKLYTKIHYLKLHGTVEEFDSKYPDLKPVDVPISVSSEEQLEQIPPIIQMSLRFNCPECSRHFSSKLYCKIHFERDHKGNIEALNEIKLQQKYTTYECSKCPTKVYDIESYKTHIKIHFIESKKAKTYFFCDVCDLKFDSKEKIVRHNAKNHDHLILDKTIVNSDENTDNEFKVKPGSYLIKFATSSLKPGTYYVKNPEELKNVPEEPVLETQIKDVIDVTKEPEIEGPKLIKNPNCDVDVPEPVNRISIPVDKNPRLIKNPNYHPRIPNYVPFNSVFKRVDFPKNPPLPKPKRVRAPKRVKAPKKIQPLKKVEGSIVNPTPNSSHHYFMMINGKMTKFEGQAPLPEPRCKKSFPRLPFKCQHCPESYNEYQFLKAHVDMIHNNTIHVEYRCGRCSQLFDNSPFLLQHMETCPGIHSLIDQTSTCSSDVSFANLTPSISYQDDVDQVLQTMSFDSLYDGFN